MESLERQISTVHLFAFQFKHTEEKYICMNDIIRGDTGFFMLLKELLGCVC